MMQIHIHFTIKINRRCVAGRQSSRFIVSSTMLGALVALLCLIVAGSILLARCVVHKKRRRDKYVRYGTWVAL